MFICTSSTRPATWGANQNGMSIFETDTKLIWTWDGAAWQRYIPKGWLATQQITADVSTSLTTFQTAVTNAVTVAGGGRRHRITATGGGVFNTNGLTELGIFRDGNSLINWFNQGGTGAGATVQPRGFSVSIEDAPASGSRTYTLQYRAVSGIGGTSTLQATATRPVSLTVVED